VSQITPHFVTRQLFCGSGKVGSESPGVPSSEVPFQLSQRADFFEEEVGLETTLKRPIVNTRDEPHCDGQRYRRFHVIVGDANRSEVATFLEVGTTAIVLSMIEDDQLPVDLTLANPVGAIRQVSHDPTLTRTVALKSGRRITALDVQWQLLEQARKYERERGLESVGDEVGAEILRRWEEVLTSLEGDRSTAATTVDWVAKERLFEAYRERHGLEWSDARLRAMDIQYHDLRDDRSLFDRFGLERLCTTEEVERAVTEPPTTTRAYFRGKCLQKWPSDIVAANWDSMVFDIGRDPLRRVPMMEPLRGTAAHVARLISDSTSAADLLERLGA
jgi:proteasome accessory factor A